MSLQSNGPDERENITTLLRVATNAFCTRIVDMTLRTPANKDFLTDNHLNYGILVNTRTDPENAKAAQATQLMERMVL